MKRLLPLLVVLGVAALPALAQSYYFSPDVPTDLAANTYLPWDIVRIDSGTYSPKLTLPSNTAVDSLHAMCSGDWLFSVEAAAELPPASGVFFEAWDVIQFDGTNYSLFYCGGPIGLPAGTNVDAAFLLGDDSAHLVISFDVVTDLSTLGGAIYDPADLVEWRRTGAGCSGWVIVGWFFQASTATPPVPQFADVTGADRRLGQTMIPYDVPTTLAGPTYLPGEVVSWDPSIPAFSLFDSPPWPANRSSRQDAFSFLPDPGAVPMMFVDKSTITAGDLTITWNPSTSAGAEDYGIYEGSIVSPWTYNHVSKVCTDAPPTLTEEITPGSGDRYYLVVALNPDLEGSYGKDSSNVERPQGSLPCRPAQGFDCP